MEELYNILISTDYVEELYEDIKVSQLKGFYALFIASMSLHNFVTITPEFAAKLYVDIVNIDFPNVEATLDNIYNFLVTKSIDELENELNENE